MSQNIASPEDQSATFIELFFDLVFVFAVTQLVGLLHEGLTWEIIGHAVLVFWLIWWAWTQFTWALNAADTENAFVEIATLVATGVTFIMAVKVPDAFTDRAMWFAVPYVTVRIIGLWIYLRVTAGNPAQRQAVQQFAALSIGGMAAVLIGAWVGGEAQALVWLLAMGLDVIAAWMAGGGSEGGGEEWALHPEHFTERHGLFTIIALGETLIVAAAGLSGAEVTFPMAAVGILAVACTCALWWTYFVRAKPVLDQAMHCRPEVRGAMGRDVFSFLHFGMMSGVIAYAIAVEEAVAHPGEALPLSGRWALAAGLALFVGGMGAALWRADRRRPLARVLWVVATGAAIVLFPGERAATSFTFLLVGLVAIIAMEQRSPRLAVAHHPLEPPVTPAT